MKNKKGFTLVELLAIIVILGILLVISVPKILSVIENSEKNAFKSNVESLIKTVEMEYQNSSDMAEASYSFPESNLNVDGDKPSSGTIRVETDSNGNYMGIVVDELISSNRKWCASKRVTDDEALIGKYTDNHCIINYFKVGDYVKMLPDKYNITLVGTTEWRVSSTMIRTYANGYGKVDSISLSPSNTELWRVIKVNDDNTVDVISEYVTDATGVFSGAIGYNYYKSRLDAVAKNFSSQYFTEKTRYMDESDMDLVKNVYGTLKASTKAGIYSPYFLSNNYISDKYVGYYQGTTTYLYDARYDYISASGLKTYSKVATGKTNKIYNMSQSYDSIEGHFRPIVTLKSDIKLNSGDGSKDYPYELVIDERIE